MIHTTNSASPNLRKDSKDGPPFHQTATRFLVTRLHCYGRAVRHNLSRALCICLIMTMLSTSTPAAAQTIVGTASEWSVGLFFWLESSGVAARVRALVTGSSTPSSQFQETQQERTAQVARIQVYPGDVTLRTGETIVFAAVAYDAQNTALGGVQFTWSGRDVGRDRPVHVSKRGDFAPKTTGTFKVTAEGAGQQAQVTVTVLEGERLKKDDKGEKPSKVREVSTRDLPSQAATQPPKSDDEQSSAHGALSRLAKAAKAFLTGSSAASPAPIACDTCGWDDGNYTSADDPSNTVGDPPGGVQDDGAGSGNFQVDAPVLGLPGRGLDISLALTYNSRLWNKSGSQMTYDIDRGWPAPGWSLGFGKMLAMGVYNGGMLVAADGTRHPYSGTVTIPADQSYTDFVGHTIDGTFIDYSYHSGLGGAPVYGQGKFPNGTVIDYYTQGTGALYPSRITDAQGNYIIITYVNNTGPNIQTITDTLGRLIQFHYDSNGLLTAITAPGVAANTTRTLVRLHYKRLTLNYGFAATMTPQVRNSTPWVVDAIYYPGTDTGYWFGDTDSYSSYGMITKAREQRGMTLTAASLTEQGTVTKGTETSESAYNYPMTANSTLTDAPTYTSKTDTWDGMDTTAAVTTYSVQQTTNPRKVTITLPNLTKSIQYSHNLPGQFNDGLLYQDETYGPGDTVPLQKSVVTWEPGAYDSARPSRSEITDELAQKTATEFDYGTQYNQVTEVRDYDYGGLNILRVARTQYENSTSYTNRHIFNLVKQVEIFAANGTTRESRTEYVYDGATMEDTPGVVQHLDSSNPYAPSEEFCDYQPAKPGSDIEIWVCTTYNPYNPATAYRGNVTQVKTYTEAATLTGPVTQTHTYDITGNLVTSAAACCEQTSYDYTSATQYAYPTLQTRGSTDPASTVRMTTKTSYSFNTGLPLSATDANNLTTQTIYFPDTLRAQKITLPTGAFTSYAYDDDALTVTETTYLSGGTVIADQNVKYLNGLGLVKREEALTRENNLDYWDVVEMKYDKLGRVWKQSLPYRSGGVAQFAETFYDELGRVIKVKAPDGSETQSFYNESTRPATASPTTPGQTTRVVNPWGRERWGRSDALGRLVEVVEPDPSPTGNGLVMGTGASASSLLTKYSYDTLGNLTLVVQGSQQRKFDYDSLGRLTRQKLAEALATLDDAGVYVSTGGKWSSAFSYDTRSNLISSTDARGVKIIYNYGNDPLNRLQSVAYNTAGVPASEQPVAASPTVTCTYMTTGDLTRLDTLTTAGVSTENFDYDTAGRLSIHTLTLTSRASYPLATDYLYDSLNRVKDMRYPAQYGVLNNPRKLVHHDYDVASRLSAVKVDGASYATGITYNAASQATSLKVGAANANQLTENYQYDDKTGSLTNQSVVRGATTTTPTKLLDLSYSYLRAGTTAGRTGQLTKITNNLDTSGKEDRAYEYDPLGRLMKASGGAQATTPLWTQTYAYDRYGNRTTVTPTGTASDGSVMPRDGLTGLSYSAATNRIVGFTYDSAGNETRAKRADGSWQQYEYDAAGRLYKIKNDAGVTLATYKYGATNQRLIVYYGDTTSANKSYYAWSDSEVIAEYAEDAATPTTPQWTKSNVYLGNRLLATIEPNGAGQFVQYHHPDRLGTRLLTNASNTNVQEQVGLPYGTALEAESTGASSRRFTSYERNTVTQLDYAINRHYDSGQGRFTQVDPIGMSAASLTDPQSLNMYAYAGNDPVNRVDPDGLFWGKLWRAIKNIFKWLAVAAAIAVAVLTIVYTGFAGFQAVLSIISAVANATASLLNALGLKTAAAVFGIIGAAADFVSSFADILKKGAEKLKSILTTISKGFTVASKVLSQVGHTKLAQVFDLVSSATEFVSNGLHRENGKYKFNPSSWDVFKFTRKTAEQIANLAGAMRIAGFFKVIGLIEDGMGIYNFFKKAPEDIFNLFKKNQSVQTRLEAAKQLNGFIKTVNSIFDRVETGAALAR